jgi:hypothetical protein
MKVCCCFPAAEFWTEIEVAEYPQKAALEAGTADLKRPMLVSEAVPTAGTTVSTTRTVFEGVVLGKRTLANALDVGGIAVRSSVHTVTTIFPICALDSM